MKDQPHKIVNLQTHTIGHNIYSFDQVTSTNDVAKKLASEGAKEGTVVIAKTQSYGKGRSGNQWLSPQGGLWFSIILFPKINPQDSLKLVFVAAIAVAKTIRELYKLNALIKWPNDVLINDKKVCGILTEASTYNNNLEFIILGVGLNANVEIAKFPDDLRSKITSIKEEMKTNVARERLLHVILEKLEHYYNVFNHQKFNTILNEWKQLSVTLKTDLKVQSMDEIIDGHAIDVDQDGALLIKKNNGIIKRIVSGHVL